MNADKIFILVNNRRTSLAQLAAMDKNEIKTVYARGCTALTGLDAPAAEYVDARGCTALTGLDAPAAEYVDARGCTALTGLDAPAAKTVYASGCTALTGLDAPAAEYVDARGANAPDFPTIDVGLNERGHDMYAVRIRGAWRVIAGCRNFTIDGARRHWGPKSSRSEPGILARVETIATEAARIDAVTPVAADAA